MERSEGTTARGAKQGLPTRKFKKNPEYVPKRGPFYEHDDRGNDDSPEVLSKEKDRKNNLCRNKVEKWLHDLFNASEQTPKPRFELVPVNRNDISKDDGPPRAMRRRRKGRGLNKYTSGWGDEDNKAPTACVKKNPPRKSNRGEQNPPLTNSSKRIDQSREIPNQREEDKGYIEREKPDQLETDDNLRNTCQSISEPSQPPLPPQESRPRACSDSDYKGFTTKSRQVRNLLTDQNMDLQDQKEDDFIQSQSFTNQNRDIQDLETDLLRLYVQDGGAEASNHPGQRQGNDHLRLQSEQKGAKRYSSESARPLFSQLSLQNYYPNEFDQSNRVTVHENAQIHPSITQVTAAPTGQTPPFAQGPPFLQPAPPSFIPQQNAQIIYYVPYQPQFLQGYQGYQKQLDPVTQPKLYQPKSSITSYSTDQQEAQGAGPAERPKAAVPTGVPSPAISKDRGHFLHPRYLKISGFR